MTLARRGRAGLRRIAAVTAVLTVVTPLTMGPAAADTSPQTQAYSSAAHVNVGAIAPQVYIGKDTTLDLLLGWAIDRVLNSIINPLVAAVANLPQQAVAGIVDLINGSGLVADDPAPVDQPISDVTTCSGLPADSCYNATSLSLPTNPLVAFAANSTSGWTVQGRPDAGQPVVAQARMSSMSLSLFGWPLWASTASTAMAVCPTVRGQQASAQSVNSSVNMFNLVKIEHFDTASGSWLIYLNSGATNPPNWQLASVTSGSVIGQFNGAPVTIITSGHGVMLTLAVSPYTLLGTLGLSSVMSALKAIVPQADLKLSVWYGPGSTVTSTAAGGTTAAAWGGGVGADLSGTFEIGVPGLATIGFTIPTGLKQTSDGTPTSGNLMSLQVAYASCNSGDPTPVDAIPPGVN